MKLLVSSVGEYKSSWFEIARNLFRSRNTQRARAESLANEIRELRLWNEQLRQESQEAQKQLEQTRQILQQQEQANEELRQQPITLPSDLALPNHTCGPKMISLCLNLCKVSGFRPTATAMKIGFDWQRQAIPSVPIEAVSRG